MAGPLDGRVLPMVRRQGTEECRRLREADYRPRTGGDMSHERSTCAVYGPPPMSRAQKVIQSLREEVRLRDCQIESLKLHNTKLRATLRKRMKPLDTVEQASTLERKLKASQSALTKAMGELRECRADLTRVQALYTAELDRTQAVFDALGARAGERVDHAAQRVAGELTEARAEIV